MPQFERYPGEDPVAARRRISRNKLNSRVGIPSRRPGSGRPGMGRPGAGRPAVRRPGPGMPPPSGGYRGAGGRRPPGVGPRRPRKPGSGGSRRMGTPSPSRVMGGRNKRGY